MSDNLIIIAYVNDTNVRPLRTIIFYADCSSPPSGIVVVGCLSRVSVPTYLQLGIIISSLRVYLPTYWLREQLIVVVEQIGSSQEIWTRGPRWTQGIKSELLHPTRYTRICLALHGPWDRARARKSQDSRSSLDTSRRVCVDPVAFDRLFNLTNDSAWTGRSPALGVKPIASFITATELVELCMLWLDKSCILLWIHCVKVVTGGLERFEWVTVLKMESNASFSVVERYSSAFL